MHSHHLPNCSYAVLTGQLNHTADPCVGLHAAVRCLLSFCLLHYLPTVALQSQEMS